MIEEVKIKLKAQHGGGSAGEFWVDVGRSDSDRLRTSADRQTMAPRGAAEQVGEARKPGRKAGKVQYDWGGRATGASPDVDRSGPVADVAQIGSISTMDFQAALPVGWAMPTSDGNTRPRARRSPGRRLSRADGVAGGEMPWAYKRDRTRPMVSR